MSEKYNLPEGGILGGEYAERLLEETEIPWETIRQEIRLEIENVPDLWPESFQKLFKGFQENPEAKIYPSAFFDTDTQGVEQGELREFALGIYSQYFLPLWEKVEEFLETTTDLLLTYLVTGTAQEIPFDWTGKVGSSTVLGEPVVFAIAGQLSDPKEITQQFMTEYNRVFGKQRPKISREFLNNADLLRMKFEKVPIKDIADEYIQRNRSQFAKDERSPQYRAQKRRLEERLKKQLQRHEKTLKKLIGDTSKG
ncbi:MAG: hypothetical protein KIT07_06465 [Anaerolineales bacterium]|nr:hypothetical protein [Anaerolineales bacterium]